MSGRIFAMHGAIRHVAHDTLTHRRMTPIDVLANFLRTSRPMVGIDEALGGQGDALTIDDATRAGYEAAIMARRLGHRVALFVNSDNVIRRSEYILHSLSALLDKSTTRDLAAIAEHIAADGAINKRRLRSQLKDKLIRMPGEGASEEWFEALLKRLGQPLPALPVHLETLRIEDLLELRDAGVDLENHGRRHLHYSVLSEREVRSEIGLCKAWLSDELKIVSRYFAVPFGDVLARSDEQLATCRCWFLCNGFLACGSVGEKIYNRYPLPSAK